MNTMIRCDFHCHSQGSPDSLTSFKDIQQRIKRTLLDKICITDHNRIDCAKDMQEKDPEHIVVGEEVMTTGGELLGFFLTERVPGMLNPMAAIEFMRKQGAVISVSHPFDTYRGWQLKALESILPFVDAIEIFNARCRLDSMNTRAIDFAVKMGVAGTVGSDAHTPGEIGVAWMELPTFNDADTLKLAFRSGQIGGKLSSPLVHAGSRWAAFVKQLVKSKSNTIDE